ncbi:MAG: histidine phosphatase family protein [Gammaproteobacteria bacterium]
MTSDTSAHASPAELAPGEQYGDATLALINQVLATGARHVVALMRHSAREYAPGVHDLENPLTPEGRALARRLGAALPKALTVRGYASPPARCMETAALIMAGHEADGGTITRHRPVEALGVFYALDQMKMWQSMRTAGGLAPFVSRWVAGDVPRDALIPAQQAADLLLAVLAARLADPVGEPQLDLCVSHDMSLHLMRAVLLREHALLGEQELPGEAAAAVRPVRFLDALLLYAHQGELWFLGHDTEAVTVGGRLSAR